MLITVGTVAGVGLLLLLLWFTAKVWLLTFAGVLLAIFLRGLSDPVTRLTKLPPPVSVALVFLILCGALTAGCWSIAPQVSEQFSELVRRVPDAIAEVDRRVARWNIPEFLPSGNDAESKIVEQTGKALPKVASFFSITFEVAVGVFMVVFLGLYFAAAPEQYVTGIAKLFPVARRPRVLEVLSSLGTTLRHWLIGQLLSMATVGILIGIGLKLLGVPLALTLGILAGLLDFIPIFGPLISAVPAVLLAFLISPWHALYVVLLYIVVNTVIESHLLVPLVQRFAVKLPPALTVVALVLAGMLFGFFGLLLATPIAAAVIVLMRMVYVEDVLGDRNSEPSAGEKC